MALRLLIAGFVVLASVSGFAQTATSVSGATLRASGQFAAGAVSVAYTVAGPSQTTAAVGRVRVPLDPGLCATSDFACVTVASPSGWIGGAKVGEGADWVGTPDVAVRAGSSEIGFGLGATGLLGFCPYTMSPFPDVSNLGIDPPTLEGDFPAYFAQVQSKVAALSVNGTTVCPVPTPVTFNAAQLLATIVSDKERAIQLGWVKDQGIGISLDAKLNAANASLARGDNKTAVNQLNALLNEVSAQAGKQLSPEAVALLQFNTQYLISKIQ